MTQQTTRFARLRARLLAHLTARALLGCAALALAGFWISRYGTNSFSWNEEVQLQSGEVIVVKRTAKAKPFGEIGGPGGWENEGMTIEIVKPKRADNPPQWAAKFVPMIFDRDPTTGEWFVVASFYSCESWYGLGKPKLPYLEFRLKEGKWEQQPLSATQFGREANMLTSISSSGEPDRNLASKARHKNDPTADPKFRHVLSTWTTGC
jgi:hypothetical protein